MGQGPMHTKTAESLPTPVPSGKPAPDKSKDSRDYTRKGTSNNYGNSTKR